LGAVAGVANALAASLIRGSLEANLAVACVAEQRWQRKPSTSPALLCGAQVEAFANC
jgi:hypothetical protein